MLFIGSISQLYAQAAHWELPVYFSLLAPCANDGNGEFLEGTLVIYFTWNNNGGVLTHPRGDYLTGSETGIKYRAVGVEILRVNSSKENGSTIQTYIERKHFVGKGTHLYLKSTYHHVIKPDGEMKVTLDKSEIICK